MLDDVGLEVTDFDRSSAFYAALLAGGTDNCAPGLSSRERAGSSPHSI
jgi:hypothetical protein